MSCGQHKICRLMVCIWALYMYVWDIFCPFMFCHCKERFIIKNPHLNNYYFLLCLQVSLWSFSFYLGLHATWSSSLLRAVMCTKAAKFSKFQLMKRKQWQQVKQCKRLYLFAQLLLLRPSIDFVFTLSLDFCNSTFTGITWIKWIVYREVKTVPPVSLLKRESISHPSSLSCIGFLSNFIFNTNWML